MLAPYVFTSLTRIADLDSAGFDVAELPRDQWADGDYIVATVTGTPSSLYRFELTNGRIVEAMEGTPAVGAFGKRAANSVSIRVALDYDPYRFVILQCTRDPTQHIAPI